MHICPNCTLAGGFVICAIVRWWRCLAYHARKTLVRIAWAAIDRFDP